ncbi:hypothetical protein BZG36_01625 [Bifiguratus adelaidae]|uniref:E2F-associated phosphoprotein n=1 Tax=Bifiguratus adelaidae TaxID=1938954 RepID=A0A261Y4D6_9FUNG|nr:hypothetical protein BZG36_01625 [Bifiguratus adelaidae]
MDVDAKVDTYEDVYFDSEDEEAGKDKKIVPSNDDLLYDPEQDDKDEAWMAKRLRKRYQTKKKKSASQLQLETDAILTCPMCFTELCYVCQRHERYSDQYRAIFVEHCLTDITTRYRYPSGNETAVAVEQDGTNGSSDEYYHAVRCEQCGTHVAMMDCDEVYHFFNVLAT